MYVFLSVKPDGGIPKKYKEAHPPPPPTSFPSGLALKIAIARDRCRAAEGLHLRKRNKSKADLTVEN